jgi:hypothetical protein
MHAQQKWHRQKPLTGANSGLFKGLREACKMAHRYLLFRSQLTVTNQRAAIGNQGIARFINSTNVGFVHAPATYRTRKSAL